ncbi:MAG: hypothetical protein WD490_07595 [Opitutales bacterium]
MQHTEYSGEYKKEVKRNSHFSIPGAWALLDVKLQTAEGAEKKGGKGAKSD